MKTSTPRSPRESITRSRERDGYILAQALYRALKAMEGDQHPWREESNMADMRLMLDTMFPSYKAIFESQDRLREQWEREGRPSPFNPVQQDG